MKPTDHRGKGKKAYSFPWDFDHRAEEAPLDFAAGMRALDAVIDGMAKPDDGADRTASGAEIVAESPVLAPRGRGGRGGPTPRRSGATGCGRSRPAAAGRTRRRPRA